MAPREQASAGFGGLASAAPSWDTLFMNGTVAAALADISLPDTDGKMTRLGSLWAEGPAVVVFLRHYG